MNIPRTKGFTLTELITVIVITGILAGMVAIFIQSPVQGYVSSASRAALSDMADTAIRRIGRDLRTAVPNSVRMAAPSGSTYVEFLPTRDGGMYLALPASSGSAQCGGTLAQDILDFTVADSCFAIMGPPLAMIGPPSATPDYIVLGSIESPPASPTATPAYDSSTNGILRAYTGATASVQAIHYTATRFPLWAQVQGQRFQVVPGDQQAVTYACIGTLGALDASGNGQAQLIRYWGYGFNPAQVAPPLGGQNAILVNNVSGCNIVSSTDYQNNSLVAITLQLTKGNESVQLYDEIHVTNIP
jgi:MSHA biogenesis protein MshO